MEWMFLPLRRYADFSGRSRRLEYWLFTLFFVMVTLGGGTVLGLDLFFWGMPVWRGTGGIVAALMFMVVYLALFIPMLAVQVRRLHDQDKSGWFVLLGFIPYVGGFIMLVLMCIDGTPGPNRFGPDPKGRGDTLADIFV